MKVNVVIVAGGQGKRMQSDLPKQFLELKGKPILMHTVEKFQAFADAVYLVLPKAHFQLWHTLVQKYAFDTPVNLVEGGAERFFSVKNALNHLADNELVLIHDAVRPLVSDKVIQNVIAAISENEGVVPVVTLKDSLRKLENAHSIPVNRSDYRLVQTPQGFNTTSLKKAYDTDFQISFTDDASVFEQAGWAIRLVEGHLNNIKITTPEDLILAQALWI